LAEYKGGEYQPLEVHVDDVDVVVSIPGEHAVPKEVFGQGLKFL
jgi:hypothetical protein